MVTVSDSPAPPVAVPLQPCGVPSYVKLPHITDIVGVALLMVRALGALDALLLLASPVVLVVPEYVPALVGAVAVGPYVVLPVPV